MSSPVSSISFHVCSLVFPFLMWEEIPETMYLENIKLFWPPKKPQNYNRFFIMLPVKRFFLMWWHSSPAFQYKQQLCFLLLLFFLSFLTVCLVVFSCFVFFTQGYVFTLIWPCVHLPFFKLTFLFSRVHPVCGLSLSVSEVNIGVA